MNRLLLAFLALLVAVGGVTVWWLQSDPGGPDGVSPRSAAEASAASTAAANLSAPDETGQVPSRERGNSDRARTASDEEAWTSEGAVLLRGRVRVEGRCAVSIGDSYDDLEVYAVSEKIGYRQLGALLDEEARDLRSSFVDRNPWGIEEPDERKARILARRKVDDEGYFELPFPADRAKGHLMALGDHLFRWKSFDVDLSQGPVEMLLPLDCGAHVVGRLILPSDASDKERKFDESWVSLRTSLEGSMSFGGASSFSGASRISLVDEAGSFEFRGVPIEDELALDLMAQTMAGLSREVGVLRSGETKEILIDLSRGSQVAGTVKDSEGKPIGGARVAAEIPGKWFGFDNRKVRQTSTEVDGTFRLAAVPSRRVLVVAFHDDHLASPRQELELSEGELRENVTLELDTGNMLAGQVLWPDRSPVAQCEVRVSFDMSEMQGMGAFNSLRGPKGKGLADSDGNFRVNGLGKGPFTLRASAPPRSAAADEELEAKELWRARLDGVKPGTEDLELILEAPLGFAGIVRNVDEMPVESFRISAEKSIEGQMLPIGESHSEDFQSPDGTFLITGLRSGSWKIYVEADGFGTPEATLVQVPQPEEQEWVEFVLQRSARISGVVRSPLGSPIVDAEVVQETSEPGWMKNIPKGPPRPTATSDIHGRFTLDGLNAGKVTITASSRVFAESVASTFELLPGDQLEDVEILLRDGGRVTGEVFNSDGRPAAGMQVTMYQMETFKTEVTTSDGEGTFLFEHLVPGKWQVFAMPSNLSPDFGADEDDSLGGMGEWLSEMKRTMVGVLDGEEIHVRLGEPPADPVIVNGEVTHDGAPYASAIMSFYPEATGIDKAKIANVDKSGKYEVTLDAPGEYLVIVQKIIGGGTEQNTLEFTVSVPDNEHCTRDFEIPTGRISGQAKGPGGEPAVGTRVSLRPAGGISSASIFGKHFYEDRTDDDGRFDIQGLSPGTYTVAVGGMPGGGMLGGEARYSRVLRSDLEVGDGQRLEDIDFELETPGRIEARVLSDGGNPVAGAALFVRDSKGVLMDRFSWITTNAAGTCAYGGLAPGEYTISARKGQLTSASSQPIRVQAGETSKRDLNLAQGVIIVVSVQGEDGLGLRADISVTGPDGNEVGGMLALSDLIDQFGDNLFTLTERRVGPLPPGKYRVFASTEDGRSVNRPVNLRAGKSERKLRLRFR